MRRIKTHQHLVRNLRIARFIRACQAQAIAAQNRCQSIKKKEDGKKEEYGDLTDCRPLRKALAPSLNQIRSRGFQGFLHFQQFLQPACGGLL